MPKTKGPAVFCLPSFYCLSLKKVIAIDAVKSARLHTALLESTFLSRTGIGRCDRAFL
jgi:hypothetical protein